MYIGNLVTFFKTKDKCVQIVKKIKSICMYDPQAHPTNNCLQKYFYFTELIHSFIH